MQKKLKEREIIDRFINSGIISGWFLQEIPVGLKIFENILAKEYHEKELTRLRGTLTVLSRKIDLVCIVGINRPPLKPKFKDWLKIREELKGTKAWLFEVKDRLNAEALGEILINEYLFKKDNPDIHVIGKGIICGKRGPNSLLIGEACKAYRVKVFFI